MATVLAFASFDRSLRVALAPRGLLTRRRASRARGPSAPSAERAMDPCFPISGASCRRAGTAPARSRSQRRAVSLREERRTRAPRASSLRVWFRDVEDAHPKRLARPYRAVLPRRLPVSRPSARRHWQSGPDRSRRHRVAPSRAMRPCRDSTAPGSLRSVRLGRDPSMGGVQPSCQRSAPGIRVDSPCSAETEPGWVSRFTSLHPLRPAVRAPLRRSLPEGRPPDESLALLGSSATAGFAATAVTQVPRRRFGPPRERQTRSCERRVPSADEEHPKGAPARALPREPPCLFADRPEPLG
jgi:hypothetical protein